MDNHPSEANQETSSVANYNEIMLACTPSKLGRKGDPRMQKALQARLYVPNLSLLDALVMGGFEFHWEGNVSYDKDHVQLSQRKNQLSRRLRLHKQSLQKNEGVSVDPPKSSTKRKRGNSVEPKKKKSSSIATTKGERNEGARHPIVARKTPEPSNIYNMSGSGRNVNMGVQMMPCIGSGHISPMLPFQQSMMVPRTVYAGNCMPKDDVRFVEGKAVSVASSNSSISSDNETIATQRLNQALNLYHIESSVLMKRCMISAGLKSEENEEFDDMYLRFGEKALENEKKRLQTIRLEINGKELDEYAQVQVPLPTPVPTQAASVQTHNSAFPSMIQGLLKSDLSMNVPNTCQSLNATVPQTKALAAQQDTALPLLQQPSFIDKHNFNHQSFQANVVLSNATISETSSSIYNEKINSMTSFQDSMDAVADSHLSKVQSFGNSIEADNLIVGPKVLDLKDVNIEGDEWKAILRKSQPHLDNIIGENNAYLPKITELTAENGATLIHTI